jgi:hypothetical protein
MAKKFTLHCSKLIEDAFQYFVYFTGMQLVFWSRKLLWFPFLANHHILLGVARLV